jgi:hypothetical protein
MIMRVCPKWARHLGLSDCRISGIVVLVAG